MAFGTKYTFSFKSLGGIDYNVLILVDGYTGSSTALTPAVNPFEVGEIDDSDIFTPIRTQSGYIRVMCSDELASQIIPTSNTSHMVRLTTDGDIVWQGYMKAEEFSSDMWRGTDEHEFPIMCMLSVLQYMEPEQDTSIKSIRSLIKKYMTDTKGSFSYVLLPGYANTDDDIDCKVSMMNYLEHNDEIDMHNPNTWNAKANRLEVLTDICRFFGWTMRVDKETIIISQPEYVGDDIRSTPFSQLDSYQSDIVNGGLVIDISTLTMTSTDQQYDMVPQYGKAKVTAKMNSMEAMLNIPLDEVKWKWIDTWHDGTDARANRDDDITLDPNNIEAFEIKKLQVFNRCTMWLHESNEEPENKQLYCVLTNEDKYKMEDAKHKHNYNFKQSLKVVSQTSNSSWRKVFSMWSHDSFSLVEGMLCVSAKICTGYSMNHPFEYNGNPTKNKNMGGLRMQIAVGDNWWTGTEWSTSKPSTPLFIDCGDENSRPSDKDWKYSGAGEIITTKTLEQPYDGAEGYGMVIGDTPIYGPIQIEIYQQYDARPDFKIYEISDLKVSFIKKRDILLSDKSKNVYKKVIGSGEEYTIDQNLASDNNNKYSTMLLFDGNGKYLQKLLFNGFTKRPEQFLLERIVSQFSVARKCMTIHCRDIFSEAELVKRRFKLGTKYYSAIAVKHNYADDEVELKLINI